VARAWWPESGSGIIASGTVLRSCDGAEAGQLVGRGGRGAMNSGGGPRARAGGRPGGDLASGGVAGEVRSGSDRGAGGGSAAGTGVGGHGGDDAGAGARHDVGRRSVGGQGARSAGRAKRADARRNEKALLDAAAAVFVAAGVDAPVRDIAAKAGVGMGTIYRHFPTRADLIIAVYRHQVDACAEAGPELLAGSPSPHGALGQWIDLFVDFLVTKHGLAGVLQSDNAGFEALHAYFLDRLVPVCAELLDAAVAAGEIRSDLTALELMRGVGNLCIGADNDPRYDARRLVEVLVAGLRQTR
jgi:AcrR family transcriptional regulator